MNIVKIKKFKLCPDLAYLTGVIIGDGHLANATKSKNDKSADYKIVVDISDKDYSKYLTNLILKFIKTKSRPKEINQSSNRKKRYCMQFRNKSLFYFFTIDMEIPKGKKSDIVKVPTAIINSDSNIRLNFLAGLFDTDGGFRGGTLGFTSASKKLILDISVLLNELKIRHMCESWINKNYNKQFYGIRIKKNQIDKFLNTVPFRNFEKRRRILNRFL
ncbi:hypothetical protein C0585_05545 [Candidatus Woesearchaeota archaeon]|nr:MAG: hypothetical protein C0585_05545 [Candidatus Woesearchaeota archaeon]